MSHIPQLHEMPSHNLEWLGEIDIGNIDFQLNDDLNLINRYNLVGIYTRHTVDR